MKKIYISFLVVFVVFAAVFTLCGNLTAGIVNTVLIAVGEGGNIAVDRSAEEAKRKKAKRTPMRVVGAGGMAAAAQLKVSKEKSAVPPLTRLAENREKQKFRKNLFLLDWVLLGPFRLSGVFEKFSPAAAVGYECVKNESELMPSVPAPEGTSWQNVTGLVVDGRITLSDAYKRLKGQCVSYAVADVEVAQDYSDALLWVGSREDIKVWLDGKEVFVSDSKTPRRADARQIKVNLAKGRHRIIVKAAWSSSLCFFYLRFTDSRRVPLIPVRG